MIDALPIESLAAPSGLGIEKHHKLTTMPACKLFPETLTPGGHNVISAKFASITALGEQKPSDKEADQFLDMLAEEIATKNLQHRSANKRLQK